MTCDMTFLEWYKYVSDYKQAKTAIHNYFSNYLKAHLI